MQTLHFMLASNNSENIVQIKYDSTEAHGLLKALPVTGRWRGE